MMARNSWRLERGMLSIYEMPGINKLPTPSSQTSLLNSEKMAGYYLEPLIQWPRETNALFQSLAILPSYKILQYHFFHQACPERIFLGWILGCVCVWFLLSLNIQRKTLLEKSRIFHYCEYLTYFKILNDGIIYIFHVFQNYYHPLEA